MTALIRKTICEKICQTFRHNIYNELEVPSKKHVVPGMPVLQWSPKTANEENHSILKSLTDAQYEADVVQDVRFIPATGKDQARVEFTLHSTPYLESLLCDENNINLQEHQREQHHMVFEYSSPNIAKPFHVGHLRSTIIGNVLANLHKHLGYSVTRMNYLGDWGTQFGMLQLGLNLLAITEEDIRAAPLQTLYKAYVKANEMATVDATLFEKARSLFQELESGKSTSLTSNWQQCRLYTMKELENVYKRLGVHFDIYDWESQYSQEQMSEVLKQLQEKCLLFTDDNGRKVVDVGDSRVPLIKSDGTTLYLARDIAALLDRWRRFKFEQIFYVVEKGQCHHFNACFQTTAKLNEEIPLTKLNHVKFGRVHGMSTRKGNAVFLTDLLDEARDRMLEKQLESSTTKINLKSSDGTYDKSSSDILGITAVIINDLRQRRQRDYEFSWDKALQMNGDSGIKLQYTHCRLHSLIEQNSNIPITDSKPSLNYLNEPIAIDLLYELSRFYQNVWQSKEQLEACILVNYLFALCNTTSRALKQLPVKSETNHLKQINRLLLFKAAKSTLAKGMNILGLKILNRM